MLVLHISCSASNLYKEMIEAEKRNGCDVKFLYYSARKGLGMKSAIAPDDLLHYEVNSVMRGPLLLLKRLGLVAKFACKNMKEKPSMIYGHMFFSDGYIARKIGEKYGVPYIVAVRNTDINLWFYWKIPWLRLAGFKTLRCAEKIVFLSEAYKRELIKRLPTDLANSVEMKAVVWPNGIDPFWHKNAVTSAKRISNGDIRLITIGRVEDNKNQIAVKKAMDVLRDRGYSMFYTVIGDVVNHESAKRLEKDERIRLIPFKEKEEQIAYYRESDIFVMPSIHETFGLVYAEAMSQGLPVIYTEGQGFDGQFPEGVVGYHVDCRDAVEIADAVERITENYAQISKNCIDCAKEFDWDRITKAYLHENYARKSPKCSVEK